ncbi:hypothetical protein [Bifidobacterium oedipodis]|uniref:Uncharacterized protein n=1 Tax=Bifidobacterium oedipodis TaxID=2675322 RepID=A0A7Y0ERA5_9BIFI|nr:hypothetical protein [Bifidobacterium sp. DSM 109957]NMM93881.1 hypothetical protein [Bifidobacterium sp. DSM 109957]
MLKQPETAVGPELPAVRPDDGMEWLPLVKRWYESVRTSPLAQRMGVEPDWFFVMETALLMDDFWRQKRGRNIAAAEIRQRCAMIGVTPKARNDLKFDAPQADDLMASTGAGSNVVNMDDFRRRREAVGG